MPTGSVLQNSKSVSNNLIQLITVHMVYALIVACSIMDGNFYINTYRQYKRSSCLLIQLFDKLIMMTLLPAKLT